MSNRKSPLRERLLSNSPDPIKSSILRESGMGWNPNPQPQNTGSVSSTSSADSLISPLRIEKRDTPVRPRGPPIPRRTSSSYKHMHSNNLVSKSPFKSHISAPASSTTRPEQPIAISFPMTPTRRVSGEKRQRPSSMHELAETENSRPFALKRERKQSKAFEVLLEKEAVTKSPFRVAPPEPSDKAKSSAIPIPKRRPASVPPPETLLRPETPSSQPSTSPRPSPGRSALVSRRMHGPRLSGSGRRERRKTVTFDERCDVVEFDRDDDSDNDVFASSEEEDGSDENSMEYEPHQQIEIPTLPTEEAESDTADQDVDQDDDASYEDASEEMDDKKDQPMLDPDASITGLVDNLFFNEQDRSLADSSFASATHTPPRQSSLPPDLETEGNVPLGRSHHVERFLQHHSPHLGPQRISPKNSPGGPSPGRYPFSLNLPTQASLNGSPATPPRRSPGMTHSTPPLDGARHAERVKGVRDHEDDEIAEEVSHLPPSPSPMNRQVPQERAEDASISQFDLDQEVNASATGREPAPSRLLDEERTTELEASLSVEQLTLFSESQSPSAGIEGADDLRDEECAYHDADDSDESDEGTPTEVDALADVAAAVSISPRSAASPSQRPGSPLVRDGSPLARMASPSTGALQVNRPRINKDDVKRRLMGRRSFCSPSPEPRSPERSVEHRASPLLRSPEINPYDSAFNAIPQEQDRDKAADRMSIMTSMTDMSTDTAIVAHAERGSAAFATLVTPQEADEDDEFGVLRTEERLNFDFGSRFSLGGLGTVSRRDKADTSSIPPTPGEDHEFRMIDHDVDIDMNSALDRLMEDVAGGRVDDSLMADDSMLSNETCMSEESEAVEVLLNTSTSSRPPPTRSETAPTILPSHVGPSSAFASGSFTRPPPPLPPKDFTSNAREARERLILQKRRQARGIYNEDTEDEDDGDDSMGPIPSRRHLNIGRTSHRRTMSVGDVETLTEHQKNSALLELGDVDSDNLLGNIEQALSEMKEEPKKKRYNVRERQNTIYASASDDKVAHLAGAGDIDTGRPWRPVRRPSDMNQYAKEIREYRAQDKSKAYGKVFVKVLGLKNVCLPMPREPTAVTCTLNNGIHFVTTPDCQLNDQNCTIEQEFELIEHSKLEFTLTIKVRRDPHIITQFKALSAPPTRPTPIPAPIPLEKVHTKSSSRFSLFSSTPKKHKDRLALTPVPTPPPQSAQPHHLPENLARYLKPDGTLARAFIAFKDVIHRCDTRLFETSYPLIGQRAELGGKFSTQQVGEIVIQMFRLPPLPGVPPEDLPQSLEECHRGLRHINWHKVTYFQGTLTQNGGDCSTWRRRHFRVIGGMLVAFNDVTKKATATIDLSKATRLEDDKDRDDESLYGVERSFRLFFPNEEIVFFADTDDEKNKWLEILRALVGHIPPHPLWGELLWQRQEEIQKRAQAARTTATTYDPPALPQFPQ